MKNIIVKITRNYKQAFFALLAAVIFMQAHGAAAQTTTAQKTEPASAAAKRALADIDYAKVGKIKDARMRKAYEQSYKALRAVAGNKSKSREAALIKEFDRTVKNLKALPQPTGGGMQECDNTYDLCMEQCKLINGVCEQCGWGQNLCYLVKLGIEMTKNPELP